MRARRGLLSLALEGRFDLPVARALPAGTFETSFAGGSAVPCLHLGSLQGCAVVTVGRLQAQSRDVTGPRADAALKAYVGLRVGTELDLTPAIALFAHVDGLASPTPTSLELDGVSVETLPTLSAGLGAGLAARFP